MISFDDEFEDIDPTDARALLSAYLDGEVSDSEREVVEAALQSDPAIRAECTALRDTRSLIRDLPLLEMPPEFAARLARRSPIGPVARPRRRARSRAFAVSAVASLAFWGAIAGAGDANAVVPDLASVVVAHTSASADDHLTHADPEIMFTAPVSLDSFELVYASRRGPVAHAMYTDGSREISVFQQPGRVVWDGMPSDGKFEKVADATAWTGHYDGMSVLLIERRGMVYTLVASSDSEMDEMSEMSSAMPGDDDSWMDHLRRASRRATDFFGFDS